MTKELVFVQCSSDADINTLKFELKVRSFYFYSSVLEHETVTVLCMFCTYTKGSLLPNVVMSLWILCPLFSISKTVPTGKANPHLFLMIWFPIS